MRCQIGVRDMWQSIETAPKKGRHFILLLGPSGIPQVARPSTWWTAGFSAENKPRFWMEIPQCVMSHNAAPTQHETATDAENTDETDS